MIAALTGTILRTAPGDVVIDVNGVGYRVFVPLSTYARMPSLGEDTSLRIVTVVREDEISLYGFSTEEEEYLFTLLQNVSGVGPRLALKILSGIEPGRLLEGIASGDTALLTTISGVGKKMAQRLVVELKDKVGEIAPAAITGGSAPVAPAAAEALDALIALGYPQKIAKKAVDSAAAEDAVLGTEEIIRRALKGLAPKR